MCVSVLMIVSPGVGSCARWSAGVAGGVGAASVAAVGVAFLEYVQMRAERVKASSEMDDLTWMMLREGAGEGLVMEYVSCTLYLFFALWTRN